VLGKIPYDTQSSGSAVSETMIQRIHRVVPGKPIRYFAGDPSPQRPRGRRQGVVRRRSHVARPGANPMIEAIARKRVLTDGTRTVELINVGTKPHTEEALVVWLPAERIVFQGDLFYYDGEPGFPERDRLISMAHFGRWLERVGLKPARIYGTHDRGVATMDHVRRAIREAGAAGLSAR
jgi:glyoxylase-like metal-dependent hydrolase (beta-lactamase superfamily II)